MGMVREMILQIKSCAHCPYCCYRSLSKDYACGHPSEIPNRKLLVKSGPCITEVTLVGLVPEWCPLPEKPIKEEI